MNFMSPCLDCCFSLCQLQCVTTDKNLFLLHCTEQVHGSRDFQVIKSSIDRTSSLPWRCQNNTPKGSTADPHVEGKQACHRPGEPRQTWWMTQSSHEATRTHKPAQSERKVMCGQPLLITATQRIPFTCCADPHTSHTYHNNSTIVPGLVCIWLCGKKTWEKNGACKNYVMSQIW